MARPHRWTDILASVALCGALLCGCAPVRWAAPPETLADYERMQQTQPDAYPARTIRQHNLQRVLDPHLPAPRRVASLKLLTRLGDHAAGLAEPLAPLLAAADTPPALREAALEFLLQADAPHLAEQVARVLPQLSDRPAMRQAVLDWLAEHPQPEVLAEVVKLWAAEASPTGPHEPQYRQVVERLTGRRWPVALLEALNSPSFGARGSAMEVLAARMSRRDLADRVASLTPRSDAVRAIRAFLDHFGTLPATGPELMTAVVLHQTQEQAFVPAGRLAGQWRDASGYRFALRDFGLLAGLAADPLRAHLGRTQLILRLGKTLNARQHVPTADPSVRMDSFWQRVDSLTMADLWNVTLLHEMLTRPRLQVQLRILAQRDRRDTKHAWGGVFFYENGQAEGYYYPSAAAGRASDRHYVPPAKALRQLRRGRGLATGLCLFKGRFETTRNAGRAGPDREDLEEARAENIYGLILTSIDAQQFCAHYYNPRGGVVSLGVFPFR